MTKRNPKTHSGRLLPPQHKHLAKDICVLIDFKRTILETSFHKQGSSIEVSHAVQQDKVRVRLRGLQHVGSEPATGLFLRRDCPVSYTGTFSVLAEKGGVCSLVPNPNLCFTNTEKCERLEKRNLQTGQVSMYPLSGFNE